MRAFTELLAERARVNYWVIAASKVLPLLLWLILTLPTKGFAHSLNDSYLDLVIDGTKLTGTLQLAFTDLEVAVGLDSDGDSQVSWGETKRGWDAIRRFVLNHVEIDRADRRCALEVQDYGVAQLGYAPYLAMSFIGTCEADSGDFKLGYSPMFDLDNSHRGFVAVTFDKVSSTYVLNPNSTALTLDAAGNSFAGTLLNFIGEGVWHIWIGIDHILFLIAMLLGVVLYKRNNAADHKSRWLDLGIEVLRLVTAFTVAHSITLVLASLELVSLPSRLVEASIALSVVVSGVNIIYPLFGRRHWQFAFLFGLIHGFGFANVLADLNLSTEQFLISLLGFNIGVELGQLLIVVLSVPVLVLIASQHYVRRFGATLSGLLIANIGLFWFIERSL